MQKQEKSEKRFKDNRKNHKLVFTAIAIALVLWSGFWLTSNARNFSITSDEVVYLPVGIRFIERGDNLMNNEHPPIFKVISAIPAVFLPHNIDKAINEDNGNQWKFGFTFWFSSGNDVQNLLFAGRAPTIILTLLMLLSVWLFVRRWLGEWAGLGALASLVFNPNILAHGGLIANDIYLAAAAWFLFVSTFYFIRNANWKTALWFGAAIFFAALSKYTGLIFVGLSGLTVISCFVFAKKKLTHPIMMISMALFTSFVLTWSIFVFVERREVFSNQPVTLGLSSDYEKEVSSPIKKSVLLPYARIREGIVATSGHNKIGHRAYLNGEISHFGWRSYFLWVLWYKTPTVILLFALFGVFFAIRKKNWALLFLLFASIISLAVASVGHIQTGVRYILFIYLALAPFVGLALQEIIGPKKNKIFIPILAVIGLMLAGDIAAGGMSSIGYFSYLSGGWQNGYKHLADSNLDWGEEFYLLENYVGKNHPKNLIVGISSGETLKDVGIESRSISDFSCGSFPADSTVIASRNFVTGFFGPYSCLLKPLESGKAKVLGRTYLIIDGRDLADQ